MKEAYVILNGEQLLKLPGGTGAYHHAWLDPNGYIVAESLMGGPKLFWAPISREWWEYREAQPPDVCDMIEAIEELRASEAGRWGKGQ
jgi:hypothetical protein